MNKIKWYIGVALLAVVGFSSCEKFLEENNRSALTSDFYKTKEGIQALVNSCYTLTREWYNTEVPIQIIEGGTDLFNKGNDNKQHGFAAYDVSLNGTQAAMTDYWKYFYLGIEWTNTALANIDNVPMDAALKTKLKGEASFLRAFFYWHIVETWGNVILTTTPSDATDPNFTAPKRSSIGDFYTRIIEDLQTAINSLQGVDSKDGKVSEWAAKSMMARVLLYRASEYNKEKIGTATADADAKEAARLAVEVIEKSGRSLYANFADIWDMKNFDGGKNNECVWFVNFTADLNYTANFSGNGGNQAVVVYSIKYDNQPGLDRSVLYGRPYNRVMVSLRALQLFDESIDQRYHGSFRDTWLVNSKDKLTAAQKGGWTNMKAVGDTAMWMKKGVATAAERAWANKRYQIFDYMDVYRTSDATKVPYSYNALQGVQLNKFQDSTRASVNEVRSARDGFVFRIAELYLIASEAYWRANDPTNAVKYMNLLREKRAIAGHEEDMKISSSDLTLDFYLDENAREFIGELHRWFDLKRTKKLAEYVNKYNPDAKADNAAGTGTGRVTDTHYLRPIPQTQLDAVTNPEEFTQNPGYN